MSINTTINKRQQKTNRFTIVLLIEGATQFVEIHESKMDGWMLNECFFLPSFDVCYFGWDENADGPEWINLEKEARNKKVDILCNELVKYKTTVA